MNTPDIEHLLNPPEHNAPVFPVTYISDADLPNRSVITGVRQWLNDNRNWKAVSPGLPEVRPQFTSSQSQASVQNLPIQLSDLRQTMGGHVLVCTTEGIEERRQELWKQLHSIATRHFKFVRTCYPLYGRC